jgi:hypothetical protein
MSPGGKIMNRDPINLICRELGFSESCDSLLSIGIPGEDLLKTLHRIQTGKARSANRRWNLYREIINTIRGRSVFMTRLLSVEVADRKKALDTLRALYLMEPLNYRDRLILLTKFILAQINPLGNAEIKQYAVEMVEEFLHHENSEVRNATFRGITFEVARLRLKGGEWYVRPLIEMLVNILKDDAETREYIRTESMEVYYTKEQRDVVDDILVAVALSLSSSGKGDEECD